MKIYFRVAICCTLFSTGALFSQSKDSISSKVQEEDEGPVMFQFEPNYETARMLQREALMQKIKALDTLNISDKKRHRLIKALYKESRSVKFERSVLVDTQFEEDDFEN